MKHLLILILFLSPNLVFTQITKTLNTSRDEDNYTDLEIKTLYQINFTRILNKLKPLYTNQSLNHYSRTITKRLQTENIDTSISNTILIYYNDSIPLNNPLLKDTFDLIGIYSSPHKYNCQLMVITLDKKREQIKWKELDCPEKIKVKKKSLNLFYTLLNRFRR